MAISQGFLSTNQNSNPLTQYLPNSPTPPIDMSGPTGIGAGNINTTSPTGVNVQNKVAPPSSYFSNSWPMTYTPTTPGENSSNKLNNPSALQTPNIPSEYVQLPTSYVASLINKQNTITQPQPQTSSISINPSPQNNLSSFTGGPNTYADILNSINQNLSNYQQASQQNQSELQAQSNLINSIQRAQNFRTNLTAGELNQYGVGRPLVLSTGRASQLEFNNQVNLQNLQNAENIASTQLGLEQQNRQIRAQAAQGALQGAISIGGLVKPESLYPGSSLVSPTGQVMYQGSGFTAPSLADVASLANSFVSSGQAPDYQTAYGMAVNALKTGFGTSNNISSLQNNGSTVPTVNGNNILGYDISSYASNPEYGNNLANLITQMPTSMSTPTQIQNYINQTESNSPITGQMIYDASSTYGVSPKALTAILQQETQLGTDKSAGSRYNNPGNYGNSDQAMANGTPVKFATIQDGIDHTAQWLSNHYVGNGQQSNIPAQLQPALETTSNGVPYLNQDKIPSNFENYAQTFSSQSNIPILTGDEVGKMRSIDVTSQNLQQMGQVLPKILGSGFWGRLKGLSINPGESFLQTNQILSSFQTYRDTAINAIQALAGGSGSGFRLNQAEINTATSNLPTINDNLETAQNKLAIVQSFLNKWQNQLLPNQSVPTNPNQISANPNNMNDPTMQYLNSLGY